MPGTYQGPRFEDAKVRDAMRVGVVTCQPETMLSKVAAMMVHYDIHSVVVTDFPGKVRAWGIVTSLDLARVPHVLDTMTAGEVASTDVITIPSDAPLKRAAELMAEHGVTHLVAVEPDTGQPAGMISARGLADVLASARS
jgi:CBS domain-containing protein